MVLLVVYGVVNSPLELSRLVSLIEASIVQWRVEARVTQDGQRARLMGLGGDFLVSWSTATLDEPAHWLIEVDDGSRPPEPVRSIVGLLLSLRSLLEPSFIPGRPIIGARPLSRTNVS